MRDTLKEALSTHSKHDRLHESKICERVTHNFIEREKRKGEGVEKVGREGGQFKLLIYLILGLALYKDGKMSSPSLQIVFFPPFETKAKNVQMPETSWP